MNARTTSNSDAATKTATALRDDDSSIPDFPIFTPINDYFATSTASVCLWSNRKLIRHWHRSNLAQRQRDRAKNVSSNDGGFRSTSAKRTVQTEIPSGVRSLHSVTPERATRDRAWRLRSRRMHVCTRLCHVYKYTLCNLIDGYNRENCLCRTRRGYSVCVDCATVL